MLVLLLLLLVLLIIEGADEKACECLDNLLLGCRGEARNDLTLERDAVEFRREIKPNQNKKKKKKRRKVRQRPISN